MKNCLRFVRIPRAAGPNTKIPGFLCNGTKTIASLETAISWFIRGVKLLRRPPLQKGKSDATMVMVRLTSVCTQLLWGSKRCSWISGVFNVHWRKNVNKYLICCISSKARHLSSCPRGLSGSQAPWMEIAPYGNYPHGFSFYYFHFVVIILTDWFKLNLYCVVLSKTLSFWACWVLYSFYPVGGSIGSTTLFMSTFFAVKSPVITEIKQM